MYLKKLRLYSQYRYSVIDYNVYKVVARWSQCCHIGVITWLQPFYNLVNFIGCNDNVSLHVYVCCGPRDVLLVVGGMGLSF